MPLVLLAACSTVVRGPTQEVQILTPGVEGAVCMLETPGARRRVWVPTVVNIEKSHDPLSITCLAPGNREKTILVEPVVDNSAYMNLANAGVGALVDLETGAMFEFPETIVVDFRDIPSQPMPLPAYQQLLKENPNLADVEEFRPGMAILQRDRYQSVPQLIPRETGGGLFSDEANLTEIHSPSGSVVRESSGEGRVSADDLTRQWNPGVFEEGGFVGGTPLINEPSGSDAGGAPVPITPGEIY